MKLKIAKNLHAGKEDVRETAFAGFNTRLFKYISITLILPLTLSFALVARFIKAR